MKKKIFNYLFVVIAVLLCVGKVYAECGGEVCLNYDNSGDYALNSQIIDYFGSDTSTSFKITTTHKIAYCSDPSKNSPVQAEGVGNVEFINCSTRSTNDLQLAYIFENGYNTYSGSLSSSDKENYYVTAMAIWNYTGGASKISAIKQNTSNSTAKKINDLISDASDPEPSLTINASSTKMTLTSDGNYYVSGKITLGGKNLSTNITASVSGATGAFVTKDTSATSGATSFKAGDYVYVKVPASSMGSDNEIEVKLAISASSKITHGTITECEARNDSIQNIIYYTPTTTTLNANKTFNATVTLNEVTISKTDIAGSKEIAGAHLVVKDSKGNVVTGGEWDSETTPKKLSLQAGTYTLTETIAPYGYIKSSETITFVVGDDGKVKVDGKEVDEVKMKNEPILVHISKRSIRGKDELPGAKLKITNKDDGKIIKDLDGNSLEWESGKEEKIFHLAAGTYILTETIAPKGYELSETSLEFTVDKDGKVFVDEKEQKNNLIIFTNTPEAQQVPTGSAYIYAIIGLSAIAIGIGIYFIVKKDNK